MGTIPAALHCTVDHAIMAVLGLFGNVERIGLLHDGPVHELGVLESLPFLNIHALYRVVCHSVCSCCLHRLRGVVSTAVIGMSLCSFA